MFIHSAQIKLQAKDRVMMLWTPTVQGRAGYKKPPVVSASIKLGNREDDWNLAGNKSNSSPPLTRTCGGGNGRPNFMAKRKQMPILEDCADLADSEWSEEEEDDEDDDLTLTEMEDDTEAKMTKPAATRIVLEVEVLM
jgi:hypothetical protein